MKSKDILLERQSGGSGWGTHVHLWQIYADVWQNQYNIVKLKKNFFLNKSMNK